MKTQITRLLISTIIVFGTISATSTAVGGSESIKGMIEVAVDGQTFEGKPLAWNEREVHLLRRDGSIVAFDPEKATKFRQTADQFKPYSPSKIRAMLLRELGSGYEVTGTSHYMVAHGKGQRDKWPQRLEDLYRSFVRYFSIRGFKLEKPPFPLIAIVCRNHDEFMRFSAKRGTPVGRDIIGYYSVKSNRITVFDLGDNGSTARNWQTTQSTIIHEATHQVAFNTGINSRFCPPPMWVAEGLATLFEAPGMYDSSNYRLLADRINQVRFADFKKLPSTDGKLLSELVASDNLFRLQTRAAYAEAWAMTFYLVETQPRQFARYLKKTVEHKPFTGCTKKQRVTDFTEVLGNNWCMFDTKFVRFMNDLE